MPLGTANELPVKFGGHALAQRVTHCVLILIQLEYPSVEVRKLRSEVRVSVFQSVEFSACGSGWGWVAKGIFDNGDHASASVRLMMLFWMWGRIRAWARPSRRLKVYDILSAGEGKQVEALYSLSQSWASLELLSSAVKHGWLCDALGGRRRLGFQGGEKVDDTTGVGKLFFKAVYSRGWCGNGGLGDCAKIWNWLYHLNKAAL